MLAAFAVASLSPRVGHAVVVERVVAVVGEKPILLTELRQRARPFLLQIAQSARSSVERAAAETNTLREVLERMVDERLLEAVGDRAGIRLTSQQIDNAVANVAMQNGITVKELLERVRRQGITEQDFRDEMRRQTLLTDLVELRVKGRVRITEEDAKSAYAAYAREIANEKPIDLRVLALHIDPSVGPRAVEIRATFGKELADRARKGEDFCVLVRQYSDDDDTRNTCGSRGAQPMTALVPELREIVTGLKQGDVAGPIVMGDQAVLVLQMAGASTLPPFEQVRDQMMLRAQSLALEKQKKLWLGELRRNTYIDVRY